VWLWVIQCKLERDIQHALSLVVMSGVEDEECFVFEGEWACDEIKGMGIKRERVDEQGVCVRRSLCCLIMHRDRQRAKHQRPGSASGFSIPFSYYCMNLGCYE